MFLAATDEATYRNRFRMRRFGWLMERIDAIVAARGSCRILDIGGNMQHWRGAEDLWADRPIRVTLLNLAAPATDDPRFTGLAGDARRMPDFADGSFDLVYSNSVIEHVGRWSDQKAMADEVRRIAPHYFVQTPNYWFPVEPHFRAPLFHFLPEPIRLRIVMAMKLGFYPRSRTVDEAYAVIEDAVLRDHRSMAALFPDAEIRREKVALLTKSLVAIR